MNINKKIQYIAKQRYKYSHNRYWEKLFIDKLINDGYRDIWVDGKKMNQTFINIYDQYLIHKNRVYYRQIAVPNKDDLKHDFDHARKKWEQL